MHAAALAFSVALLGCSAPAPSPPPLPSPSPPPSSPSSATTAGHPPPLPRPVPAAEWPDRSSCSRDGWCVVRPPAAEGDTPNPWTHLVFAPHAGIFAFGRGNTGARVDPGGGYGELDVPGMIKPPFFSPYFVSAATWADALVIAANDELLRRDGTEWVTIAEPNAPARQVVSVCGASARDLVVSGKDGVFRVGASAWKKLVVPAGALRELACVGSGELVVVAGDLVHRGDGARWRTLGSFGPDGTPRVSPTGEVLRARHVKPTEARRFFLGELSHLVAGRWSTAHEDQRGRMVRAVWSASANDIIAVGERALVLSWDGSTWREEDLGLAKAPDGRDLDLFAIVGDGHHLWVGASGRGVFYKKRPRAPSDG